jgi:hydrogenase small subunit
MAQPNIVMNAKRPPAVPEVHILWTPDGMSCDGDTVSTTAATLPSIEDIIMGIIPGLPNVHLHNRVLDPSQGATTFSSPGTPPPRAGWTLPSS